MQYYMMISNEIRKIEKKYFNLMRFQWQHSSNCTPLYIISMNSINLLSKTHMKTIRNSKFRQGFLLPFFSCMENARPI